MRLCEIDRIRAQHHRAALLYLTDRCPVGCAHCSVGALPRGVRPPDPALTALLADGLCAIDEIRLVGISGGEPFVERRLLERVTTRLAEAGKQLVLYTSGNWGRDDGTVPGWTRDVLARAACVVLSTDSYHAAHIPEPRYLAALRAAAGAGAWVAVQVIDTPGQKAEAVRLLSAAFGPSWADTAEVRGTPLLPHGRAARLTRPRLARPARSFGPCRLLGAPVVRYDGRVTACCNEEVVTGRGPSALQATARNDQELREALAAMRRDPFLSAMRTLGPRVLTWLPRYRGMAGADICSLCWDLLGRGADSDPSVLALASAGEPS